MTQGRDIRAYIEARSAKQDCGHGTHCWVWQGCLNGKGYALASVPGLPRGCRRVHRVSYEAYVGAVPDGLHIDHLCGIKSCVNPEHLEAVTPAENNRRKDARAAPVAQPRRSNWVPRSARPARTHCQHGHELTDANTAFQIGSWRQCRTCWNTIRRTKRAAQRREVA